MKGLFSTLLRDPVTSHTALGSKTCLETQYRKKKSDQYEGAFASPAPSTKGFASSKAWRTGDTRQQVPRRKEEPNGAAGAPKTAAEGL